MTITEPGHPPIHLPHSPDAPLAADDLDWLAEYLRAAIQSGEVFAEGEMVRVGWLELLLAIAPQGGLTLNEPDFGGEIPCKYRNSTTHTMQDLRRQRYTADSFGLTDLLDFPNWRQSAIVCTNRPGPEGFVMDRGEPEGHSSGWFVGCLDPNHDHNVRENLEVDSLYALACGNPELKVEFSLPLSSTP